VKQCVGRLLNFQLKTSAACPSHDSRLTLGVGYGHFCSSVFSFRLSGLRKMLHNSSCHRSESVLLVISRDFVIKFADKFDQYKFYSECPV